MPVYTNIELTDMHFMYGRANGNAREALRQYIDAFPNRHIPSFNSMLLLIVYKYHCFFIIIKNCYKHKMVRISETVNLRSYIY